MPHDGPPRSRLQHMTEPQPGPCPLTVPELLAQQDGVISRPQVLAAGMTKDWWAWKLERQWQRVGEGVAVAHRGTPDAQQLRWAAVLHGGRGAALAGDAALEFTGVRRLTVLTHDIAVPEKARVARLTVPGLVMQPHRVAKLVKWTAGKPHLRVVHAHAAVLQSAAWVDTDEEAEHRLTLVVQQRKTSVLVLRTVLEDMPRHPRRRLIRAVLDDIEFGATAQSELDYLRFCRRNGLPEPDEMQVAVRTGTGLRYLDARYLRKRIRLEVDGGHHLWAAQWDADAIRSLQLAVAGQGSGETELRITRGLMRHHEAELVELLRQLLM
jgi:hypothetical protein